MKSFLSLRWTPLEGCEHVSTERIRGVTCEQKRDNIYILHWRYTEEEFRPEWIKSGTTKCQRRAKDRQEEPNLGLNAICGEITCRFEILEGVAMVSERNEVKKKDEVRSEKDEHNGFVGAISRGLITLGTRWRLLLLLPESTN